MWKPSKNFNITQNDISATIKDGLERWKMGSLHEYFKKTEAILLTSFMEYVNHCHKNDVDIFHDIKWMTRNIIQGKKLALLRDFHDYMCDRDEKHHIRTDDCRRFMTCVIRGIKQPTFAMPVHRMLRGDTSPSNFTHPRFIKFNDKSY